MALKKCNDCTGRFGASFFSARSLTCRLCVLRHRMEVRLKEQDEKLTIGNNKIAELSQTVDALKAKLENQDTCTEAPHTATPPSPPSLRNTADPSQPDRDFTPVRHGA